MRDRPSCAQNSSATIGHCLPSLSSRAQFPLISLATKATLQLQR